jgi:hypothetical protein
MRDVSASNVSDFTALGQQISSLSRVTTRCISWFGEDRIKSKLCSSAPSFWLPSSVHNGKTKSSRFESNDDAVVGTLKTLRDDGPVGRLAAGHSTDQQIAMRLLEFGR